jgi:ketosteroid isomerase-like protein
MNSPKMKVSDVQVHLYGDTAVVTYQKQIKQFTSSNGTSAVPGQPMSFMDTFMRRNGEWKVVATVGVLAVANF